MQVSALIDNMTIGINNATQNKNIPTEKKILYIYDETNSDMMKQTTFSSRSFFIQSNDL